MIFGSAINSPGGRKRGLLAWALALAAPLLALGLMLSPVGDNALLAKPNSGPKTHVVEIRQFKFFPATLTVNEGDTIIWKNLDAAPHTATSKDWDSDMLRLNESWELKVTGKGTTEYICAYHPVMKGKIIVK
jgi:plastocyanin